jgi:ankyrin repeat protein
MSDTTAKVMNPNHINNPDPLVWATHFGVEEEFSHCIKRGDDVNVQDEHGYTPQHAAAEEGWIYFASILVERGADIHVKDAEGDTAGITPNAKERLCSRFG